MQEVVQPGTTDQAQPAAPSAIPASDHQPQPQQQRHAHAMPAGELRELRVCQCTLAHCMAYRVCGGGGGGRGCLCLCVGGWVGWVGCLWVCVCVSVYIVGVCIAAVYGGTEVNTSVV